MKILLELSQEEYANYLSLSGRDKAMRKVYKNGGFICPVCNYIVDLNVPSQNFCNNCGQRLKGDFE